MDNNTVCHKNNGIFEASIKNILGVEIYSQDLKLYSCCLSYSMIVLYSRNIKGLEATRDIANIMLKPATSFLHNTMALVG